MTFLVSRPLKQILLAPAVVSGLVLALCLGLTAGLWHSASADAERDAGADFDFRVRELVNNIDQRMQTYIQVLYGVQGLYASSEQVDRDEFRSYLAGQGINDHFPGIQGVGYIELVDGAARASHESLVRRQGLPDYAITPAGARAHYAPVVYLEPASGSNLLAFGYDELAEPTRRAAIEQARDSGLPAMSAMLRLYQEGRPGASTPGQDQAGPAGFLVALPVYRRHWVSDTLAQRRAAIQGWVYAPFRVGDLLAGIGGQRAGGLRVQIYDGELLKPAALMYDNAPQSRFAGRETVQKISVAGHRWSVRAGLPAGAVPAAKPRLIAYAGSALGVLLALLTGLLARSRVRARGALRRAQRLAAELHEGQASLQAMAESAQRSQAVLRSILDSTVDGILVDDLQGQVLNSNRRFRALWNLPEHLDWQGDGAALLDYLAGQLREPQALRQSCRARRGEAAEAQALLRLKDGRVFEQTTRSLQLGSAAARFWSFRDITERTQIEQREQSRRHALELLATGAPLQTILERVALEIEASNPDMLCSVVLLDESGSHLLVGAAPSLPAFYNSAVNGLAVASDAGPCCRAILSGARVIVEDIRAAPGWQLFRDAASQAGLGACWSDPILSSGGKVLGSFAIYHRQPHKPSLANISLIEQAAHLAGIAIEQAQAAIALRAGEARFRSLYDHAPVALWQQDWSGVRAALSELEQSGVEDLGRYLQANPSQLPRLAALVRISDVNAAALAQVGASPADKQAGALSLAQNFAAGASASFIGALQALAGGKLLYSCESSFLRLDGVARQNELTLLVMPGHTHSLDFVIVSTLDITERKRMNEELQLLASTDPLTGLRNRRDYMARLDEELARLRRELGGPAAVLMLDLDHFKRINDEHGHAAGDAVLRHVAALMRDSLRQVDALGRVGGEEFSILLPGTGPEEAAVFAERLRLRIAAAPLQLDGANLAVTVSIGIASLGPQARSCDAVLSLADQALYQAKRSGRNRVELAARAAAPAL